MPNIFFLLLPILRKQFTVDDKSESGKSLGET